jgi:methylphosphotriester-DNA--protein-cysteine methyltransferase
MSFTTPASRWVALTTRNPAASTSFVYAVTTTRIYCRPTCPARLARRSNVEFHDTAAEAEAAGFRACKRCRPELKVESYHPNKDVIDDVCRYIRSAPSGRGVTLRELAGRAGWTVSYFHRIFKGVVGCSPKVYAARWREEKEAEQGEVGVGEQEAEAGVEVVEDVMESGSKTEGPGKTDEIKIGDVFGEGFAGLDWLDAAPEMDAIDRFLAFSASQVWVE